MTTTTLTPNRTSTQKPASRTARLTAVFLATMLVGIAGLGSTPANAGKARWVLVGRESFTIEGDTVRVPTYVNTGSIVGDRSDSFTITFQGRFGGKLGINRVNVGVVVDCYNGDANSDQFIVYYSSGSNDYQVYEGGDVSDRIHDRALSYCY